MQKAGDPLMSVPTNPPDAEADWEITPEGLYMATRHLLLRRGYCCANRCRNCPYINWHENPAWQHAPATAIRRMHVSAKAVAGARARLAWHEQALAVADECAQMQHREFIAYYRWLLEQWE